MEKPTTTLEDVQRALEEQECQLQAAYRALTSRNGAPVALPAAAIDCLREACEAQGPPKDVSKPISGIRC